MSNARKLADNLPTEGSLSGRNLLTNGAMQIWQRGTSFSTNSAYNADRWNVDNNSGGGGQSTDAPDGFTYSLKIDPSSGNAALRQAIELPAAGEGGVFRSGQKFTLSFYVKSANAGEAINIFAASATSVGATTTAQVSAQTIGTTTTSWVRHIFTFTSNNVGGSDTCYNIVPFVVSPSGATYWTGLMLEEGSQASPFEHEPVGVTLSKCQRYYQKSFEYGTAVGSSTQLGSWSTGGHQGGTTTGYIEGAIIFEQHMRAAPTLTIYDHSGNSGKSARLAAGVARYQNENVALSQTSSRGSFLNSASGTAAGIVQAHYTADAEL
jgi:hypothetical protein